MDRNACDETNVEPALHTYRLEVAYLNMILCNLFTIRRFVLSRVEIILSRAIGGCETIKFVAESNLMKRTRAATRIQQENKIENNKDDEDTVTTN